MPRLRTKDHVPRTGDASKYPAEFASDDAPVWQSGDATREWFAAHGLQVSDPVKWGPHGRRHTAIKAWCAAMDVDIRELERRGVELGGSNLGRLHWVQLFFAAESQPGEQWSKSRHDRLHEMDVEDLDALLRRR